MALIPFMLLLEAILNIEIMEMEGSDFEYGIFGILEMILNMGFMEFCLGRIHQG